MKKTLTLFIACLLIAVPRMGAQSITVKDTLMTTYPFSHPDPVVNISTVYPYWKFLEYSSESVQQSWKMVVLENDYVRVKIFPEIGGKVWSIYDKVNERELVYDNDAVKFRNIAHRGPWTSGGIEFNYGVIGHAPSCATPVDWKTEKKADGSVSCYIGVLEMTSRSRWCVEVNLEKDAAECTTKSVWHNLTGEWQPYYTWANSGVEMSDDMVLILPSKNAIGHNGLIEAYPIDEEGRDISTVSNQNYGRDKSYHMIGSHKSFFGTYFPGADWASMHWSLRDEKLGRKYFAWAQSRQGLIWKDLLTDNRPQYVELQSGRLFNQNALDSSEKTPYRQVLFSPYGTEIWCDHWMGVGSIGIADNLSPDAAVSVKDGMLKIYPLRPLEGRLSVCDEDGKEIFSTEVSLQTSRAAQYSINGGTPKSVRIGRKLLWDAGDGETLRPQTRSAEFREDSAQAAKLLSRDQFGMKLYAESEENIDKALAQNPDDVEALALKSALLYHRMKYAEALDYAFKGLAIDQYNPEAGYMGGLAAEALGRENDALDCYEIATIQDGALRQGCYTRLAALRFKRGETELAAAYAAKALKCNSSNITALCILERADASAAAEALETVRKIDPLCHISDAEDFLAGRIGAEQFGEAFLSEIPWEDYLEIAAFYSGLGLKEEAAKILEALPQQNALTALWIAYLRGDTCAIAAAEAESLYLVFPFRSESAQVLEWALRNGGDWRCSYLLALLKNNFGYKDEALALLGSGSADFAPYYAFRYKLSGENADIRKAFEMESEDWNYRTLLASDLNKRKEYAEAVALLKKYYAAHPDNYAVGDLLIDSYIGLGRYKDAEKIVDKIVYLPFEGMGASHRKYRDIKLQRALEESDKGHYTKALGLVDEALLWPERLGAGKPYDDMLDTSKEEQVRSEILKKKGAQR